MDLKIVHSDYCPHCGELIKNIEKQDGTIDGVDSIEYVKLESKKGMDILKETKSDVIPIAVTEDNITCEIEYIGGEVKILCPTKK